jgi:NAD(P)-dependent dehydrogenase (short-subunit alcohol dehydrogenase family)
MLHRFLLSYATSLRIALAAAQTRRDAAETRRYVAETADRWGKIDVLFSNAGNDGPLMPITEYPEDLFDHIVTTHVRSRA